MEDAKQERVRNTRDAKERRIEKAWGRKESFLIFSLRVLLCLHVHNSIFLSFRFKIRALLAKKIQGPFQEDSQYLDRTIGFIVLSTSLYSNFAFLYGLKLSFLSSRSGFSFGRLLVMK